MCTQRESVSYFFISSDGTVDRSERVLGQTLSREGEGVIQFTYLCVMRVLKESDPKKGKDVKSLLDGLGSLSGQRPEGSRYSTPNQFRDIKALLDSVGHGYASDASKGSDDFSRKFISSPRNRKLIEDAILDPETNLSEIEEFMTFKGGKSPVDRILDYKRSMMDVNPVTPQTPKLDPDNLTDPVLHSPKAWRPNKMWDTGNGDIPFNVGGMVQPASFHGKPSEEHPFNKPFSMGLPKSFQSRYKPAGGLLHESPEQLAQTLTHERSHTLDLPNLPLKDSVVSKAKRIDDGSSRYNDYVASPTETSARVHVLRKHLYSAGLDVFNESVSLKQIEGFLKDFNRTTDDRDALTDLRQVYSDEDIVMLINKLPA